MRPTPTSALRLGLGKGWCRRGDLNPHALAGTSPSIRDVHRRYQVQPFPLLVSVAHADTSRHVRTPAPMSLLHVIARRFIRFVRHGSALCTGTSSPSPLQAPDCGSWSPDAGPAPRLPPARPRRLRGRVIRSVLFMAHILVACPNQDGGMASGLVSSSSSARTRFSSASVATRRATRLASRSALMGAHCSAGKLAGRSLSGPPAISSS